MKRVLASLVLSLALLAGGVGVANAQLKGDVFTGKAKTYFSGVYDTEAKSLDQTLPAAVGAIIGAVLGLVGVILLVIMVYAGFLWLTAGGNDDQVGHAKQLIKNGVIGMAITLSAFVITQFVVNQLTSAIETGSSGGTAPAKSGGTKNDGLGTEPTSSGTGAGAGSAFTPGGSPCPPGQYRGTGGGCVQDF